MHYQLLLICSHLNLEASFWPLRQLPILYVSRTTCFGQSNMCVSEVQSNLLPLLQTLE
jgi:hypothetical protein